MNCKNCGSLIPEQSTFCPYCGVSSAEAQAQSSAAPQSSAFYTSPPQQPMPISSKMKGKVQICPKCGALLSKKEKVCSVCGEVMPKPKKAHKAKAAIISMSVVICLLLCSTVYFMLEMFEGNQAIDDLNETITEWEDQYQQLYDKYLEAKKDSDDWYRSYKALWDFYSYWE